MNLPTGMRTSIRYGFSPTCMLGLTLSRADPWMSFGAIEFHFRFRPLDRVGLNDSKEDYGVASTGVKSHRYDSYSYEVLTGIMYEFVTA